MAERPKDGEFVGYPTNYMLAIVEGDDAAERASQELKDAGFSEDQVMMCVPAEMLDSSGQRHGAFAMLERAIEHLITDEDHLKIYEDAAREGACVIGVESQETDRRERAQQIFRRLNAHHVNFFGDWAVEQMDGGPRKDV